MSVDNPKAFLPEVESIAREAGAEILKFYHADTAVRIKNDGSEVTDADIAAEKIILARLAKLTPDIPIVSEEAYERGEIPDISKGTFWTVDPLDGTKEFTSKTGAFVVAISLVVDNKVVLGAIYHPAFDVMFVGAGPGTGEKIGALGIREKLGPSTTLAETPRVLMNEPSTNMPMVKGYLTEQFGKAVNIDPKPGILRACQVAENSADASVIYPLKREGRTKWWDVAPGQAIVEAAGGKVRTIAGKEVRYDSKDFQVPPVISVSPNFAFRLNEGAANDPVYDQKKTDKNKPDQNKFK